MKESLRAAIARRAQRMHKARSSPQKLWAGLALVGSVGWMIVLPGVGGALLGRWLDARLDTQLSFTLALLLFGMAAGMYTGWRFLLKDLT